MAFNLFKSAANDEIAIRKVIAALNNGRILSLFNGKEFKTSQMHTVFCKIRKKISRGTLPGVQMQPLGHNEVRCSLQRVLV